MAQSVNKVILIGRLGRNPEIKTIQSGNRIANLTLATSDSWYDKQTNEKKERTEWHRVVVFNEALIKIIEKYINKGANIYLEGELRTKKWDNQNGVTQYTTEVVLQYNCRLVMLDSKGSSSSGADVTYHAKKDQKPLYDLTSKNNEFNDDIPF